MQSSASIWRRSRSRPSAIGAITALVVGLIAVTTTLDRRYGPSHLGGEQGSISPNPHNLITVAAALTAGAGDLTLEFGHFTMGGIGTATFGAIVLCQILDWDRSKE